MSHFPVMILTEEEPSSAVLASVLAPFHEFECTGQDDEYIQNLDETEQTLNSFKNYHENRKKDDREYTIAEFMVDYEGVPIIEHGEAIDLKQVHKFGYALLDEQGELKQVIRRTNPNAKWDWYQVGGRWSGMLKLKPELDAKLLQLLNQVHKGSPGLMGAQHSADGFDVAQKAMTDIDSMRKDAIQRRQNKLDEIRERFEKEDMELEDAWDIWLDLVAYGGWPKVLAEYQKDKAAGSYTGESAIQWGQQLPEEHPFRRAVETNVWQYLGKGSWDSLSLPDKCTDLAAWVKAAPFIGVWAVIKDGQWYERGKMGWWAMTTDEKDSDVWAEEVGKLLDGLPGETWVSIVDCHI